MKLQYRPMTESEYERDIKGSLEDYIKDISVYEEEFQKQMQKSPREFAEQQFNDSLPSGVNSPDNYFWIMIDTETNEEVGFLWFTVIPDRNLCLLSYIKVLEDRRGKGYGTEMLHYLEFYVAKNHPKIDKLYLHVFKHNPRAKKLYETQGFKIFYESFEGDNLIKEIKRD